MTDIPVIHESQVPEKAVPGRFLRWVVNPDTGIRASCCSSCVMRVSPGETVRPAHSHPGGEELIYIISGEGKTYIDGKIYPLRAGSVALFPQGSIHMVRNSGAEEMKVVCFFAPASKLSEYEFHPETDFDQGVEVSGDI